MGRNAKLRTDRRLARRNKPLHVEAASQHSSPYFALSVGKQQLIAIRQYPYPTYPYKGAICYGWMKAAIELVALDEREHQGWAINDWQQAQKTLLRGVLTMAGSNDYTPEGVKLIKQAGQMLGDIGGTREMYYTADLWVPPLLHRHVDIFWNGIHGWRS
jgi:hypothetical protein